MKTGAAGRGRLFFTVVFAAAFLCAAGVYGQSNFSRGEELFMLNKPGEALAFLENAVADDPAHVRAFLYLGIVYQQLGRVDEAIAAYRKILPRGGGETARIAYNLGNAYYSRGNIVFADQFYSQAIETDPACAPAYLNRANARVKNGSLREALSDYEMYLTLEPRSPKRPQIEKLAAFIREEFAAEERRRLLAEEAARAEAERKQRLLEEVSSSLQAAADESRGLSAGAEDVQGYEGEFELE
ncbi:MAG: tetratricopeptide repeat protein [Treponema sp.]|jgi:tetratricopeptide (TPR) repeat protein|nr:tetratricopeptide repeat protein [Treponema sp.]